MIKLNDKIKNLIAYEPLKGSYPIRMDVNEHFRNLPLSLYPEICETVGQVIYNRYPDSLSDELCAAFAERYGISPDLVTPGNGSDELIGLIISHFLCKGNKLVTLSPDFSMYKFYAHLAEVEVSGLSKDADFSITPERIISHCKDIGAEMVIFSNPCNPSSLGIGRDGIREIIRSLDCFVVLDEAYMDFWDQTLLNEVSDYDNLIILRTCSKAIGLAALRLGFAVANRRLTNVLQAVKSPFNVNSLTAALGTLILNKKELLDQAVTDITESRDRLYADLRKLLAPDFTVLHTVTNFVTVCTPRSEQIYEALLKQGIAIRSFGQFMRITAGTEAENKTLLRALDEIIRGEKS